MFFFWGFPFSIIIPVLIFSYVMRAVRRSRYEISQRGGRSEDPRQVVRHMFRGNSGINEDISPEDFEVYIYRLASKHRGRLTSAIVVVDSGLSMSQAEGRLNSLVDNVHIRMEVTQDGRIVYEFPDLLEEISGK